jgi:hypothetical protein
VHAINMKWTLERHDDILGRLHCIQVPVQERERILKKEGLDPTRLQNLTLIYKVQEVCYSFAGDHVKPDLAPSWLLPASCLPSANQVADGAGER